MGEKRTVLVVDDTSEMVDVLVEVLRPQFRLKVARNGERALRIAAGDPAPNLILLDVEMPVMDGYEVCEQLKANPVTKLIPVIFLTSRDQVEDEKKGLELGAVDYITKPFSPPIVLARVCTHLALRGVQLELERKYDELKKLEQLRDNLTHMIVHDLRSPLTAISGYLELLQLKGDLLSEEQQRYVDGATTGATNLIEMISSLLDVNRLESGEMPLHRETCDLSVVAARAMKSLEGLTIGREVRLEHPEEPVRAICDPGIVQRVISNLVGNALKFTPKSGSVKVVILPQGDNIRVEVRDTGYGIAPEYLERVFDKFAQVEAREEHKNYSTGLGLTFCKLATEAHGGRIGVSSEIGKGSTFWFELKRTKV